MPTGDVDRGREGGWPEVVTWLAMFAECSGDRSCRPRLAGDFLCFTRARKASSRMTERPGGMPASALANLVEMGDPVSVHRPFPRVVVDARCWHGAVDLPGRRQLTLLSLWGEPGAVHMALLDAGAPSAAVLSIACPDNAIRRSVARMRRRSGWNARCATCSASIRSACPIRGPGWITDAGAMTRSEPRVSISCRSRARTCTKSRSVRCTPASSSPGISVSPATARRWCGWSSVWATCTRASMR